MVSIKHALYKKIEFDHESNALDTDPVRVDGVKTNFFFRCFYKIKSAGEYLVQPFDGCYIESLDFFYKFGITICEAVRHYTSVCKGTLKPTTKKIKRENPKIEQNLNGDPNNVVIAIENDIDREHATTNTQANSDEKIEIVVPLNGSLKTADKHVQENDVNHETKLKSNEIGCNDNEIETETIDHQVDSNVSVLNASDNIASDEKETPTHSTSINGDTNTSLDEKTHSKSDEMTTDLRNDDQISTQYETTKEEIV